MHVLKWAMTEFRFEQFGLQMNTVPSLVTKATIKLNY